MVDPEEGRETPTDALDGGDPEPSAPVEVSSQALPGTPVDPGTATTGSRSEPISTQPRANASVSDAEGAGPAAPTSSSSLSRTLQVCASSFCARAVSLISALAPRGPTRSCGLALVFFLRERRGPARLVIGDGNGVTVFC